LRSSFGRSYISGIKFFIFQIAPIFLLSTIIKSHDQIFSALRSYIFGLKILTVLGIAQFLVYYTSGYDFLPYGLTEDLDPLSASEDMIFQNIGFLRISSLGGEPKGLAVSLVIGITMLLYLKISKTNTSIKLINVWITLMFIVLIATLSTSGFFLILVPLLIVLFYNFYNITESILKKIIIVSTFITGLFVYQDLVFEIIDARVLSRSSILLTEDIDDSIIKFLEDNPIHFLLGTGLGNIHLHAINYIQDLNLYNLRLNEIFISRYGYLKIISESGIVGFLLFLLFIIRISKRIFQEDGLISKHMLLIFFLTMATYYLLRAGYCEVEFYFFTGLIIAYLKLCKKERLLY
jgi:O-antigen ligase